MNGRPNLKRNAVRLDSWLKTWGELASTNICSLCLTCGGFQSCTQRIYVNPNDLVNPSIRESDMTAFTLTVFCRSDEHGPTPEQLRQFIIAVEVIVGERTEQQRASRVMSRAGEN